MSEAQFSWDAPSGPGRQWIEIVLDYPVNPWEHEGAGSITWGAQLDRQAPLGEEGVSIIQAASAPHRARVADSAPARRHERPSVTSAAASDESIKPGWAPHIQRNHYWIRMTLFQPLNERWFQRAEGGELVNDGIITRAVTIEATTDRGQRALQIIQALHTAHPHDESDAPPAD